MKKINLVKKKIKDLIADPDQSIPFMNYWNQVPEPLKKKLNSNELASYIVNHIHKTMIRRGKLVEDQVMNNRIQMEIMFTDFQKTKIGKSPFPSQTAIDPYKEDIARIQMNKFLDTFA
jgi:hypothetical protein